MLFFFTEVQFRWFLQIFCGMLLRVFAPFACFFEFLFVQMFRLKDVHVLIFKNFLQIFKGMVLRRQNTGFLSEKALGGREVSCQDLYSGGRTGSVTLRTPPEEAGPEGPSNLGNEGKTR